MSTRVFTVDTGSQLQRVVADTLTLAKDGGLRFRAGGKLVGVVKDGFWYRCYVEADPKPLEPQK